MTEPEPLPDIDDPVDVQPVEERPEVIEAAEDDTTAPGFGVGGSGGDDLDPRFSDG